MDVIFDPIFYFTSISFHWIDPPFFTVVCRLSLFFTGSHGFSQFFLNLSMFFTVFRSFFFKIPFFTVFFLNCFSPFSTCFHRFLFFSTLFNYFHSFASVLLSTKTEIFSVSRMRDFSICCFGWHRDNLFFSTTFSLLKGFDFFLKTLFNVHLPEYLQ